jgi:hypothetical protein
MDRPPCEIGVVGHLKGVRPGPQVSQSAEAIPLPDLLLQEAVVAFAPGVGGRLRSGVKTGMTRRTKQNRLSCPRLREWNRPPVTLMSLSIEQTEDVHDGASPASET